VKRKSKEKMTINKKINKLKRKRQDFFIVEESGCLLCSISTMDAPLQSLVPQFFVCSSPVAFTHMPLRTLD
jgi:hypothetical protein